VLVWLVVMHTYLCYLRSSLNETLYGLAGHRQRRGRNNATAGRDAAAAFGFPYAVCYKVCGYIYFVHFFIFFCIRQRFYLVSAM